MKHCVSLPHHEVLESMATPFEVDAEVVHNRDVISDLLRGGEVGEPATPFTFREVDPATCWGRCSHRSRGVSEDKEEGGRGLGGKRAGCEANSGQSSRVK